MGCAPRRMRGYWVRGPERGDAPQSGAERSAPFWEAFCGDRAGRAELFSGGPDGVFACGGLPFVPPR